MTTKEENDRLTQTDAGTPGGDLYRRYWQPVALSSDLLADAPFPTKVLGEELVLFRDANGEPGLIGMYCPHRCTDLSYGRVEDGGLRCLYHGWLMDKAGRCLDQPAEPEGSRYKDEIQHTAYPCIEKAGMIFAYMGPGAPPLFPKFHFFEAPDSQVWAMKMLHRCNTMQALDGIIDPSHLAFLHYYNRETKDDQRSAAEIRAARNIIFNQPRITLDVERTRFGIRAYAERKAGEGKKHVNSTNFVFPNIAFIGGMGARQGQGGYSVHWHVPIDDENHWRYDFYYQPSVPLDKESLIRNRALEIDDNHMMIRRKENRYLQDREEMKSFSFSGMGTFFSSHDVWAVETPGPIADRRREHLASTDMGVAVMRRMFLHAMDGLAAGKEPPMVLHDDKDNDFRDIVVMGTVLDEAADHRKLWADIIGREDFHRCQV
ncbi:MAG TPA: Rieske 2Fe-2S domain-containing protein [Alphaproteobacteria bacterium]|jgi:phenylpropionate dioxygenase-like ring-hydroxylating dioxygenase large terminal subunit